MPGQTRRGRDRPVGQQLTFQLLAFQVQVSVDDEGLLERLAYLANGAAQPVRASVSLSYAVIGWGPYELREDGELLTTVSSSDDVLYVLYQRCYARLIDHQSSSGWASIHAAMVSVAGRRALIVGDKGAGKTTLMLRLLHDGHRVEGDEAAFTRGGEVMCLPRNFHVKSGAVELVPELSPAWSGLPRIATDDGAIVTAFDPAAAGFPWQLQRGPISVAFLLRANHHGNASCRPLSSLEMTAATLANCRPNGLATADVVRECASLLSDVAAYELRVGALEDTADLLVAATYGLPTDSSAW